MKHREHVFPIISSLLSQLPTAGLPLQFDRWNQLESFVAELRAVVALIHCLVPLVLPHVPVRKRRQGLADLEPLLEVEPVARRLGCTSDLASVAAIPETGASYQRQLRVAAETGSDLVAMVDSVVRELQI